MLWTTKIHNLKTIRKQTFVSPRFEIHFQQHLLLYLANDFEAKNGFELNNLSSYFKQK